MSKTTTESILSHVDGPDKSAIVSNESNKEKTSSVIDAAPDGGTRAWLVALGVAFVFFCAMGFSNSFGVFQEYYLSHQLQTESSDNIAWIGSLAAFLQFASGAIAGPLFDRYGAWIIRPAAILFVFAVMMLSLCKAYWQFMVVQGVLVGITTGCLIFPAMAALSQFFDKKRAAALGLGVSGSSIGGVVFPIVLSKMLNGTSLGFGWTIRIVGFIMLPPLIFATMSISARLPPRTTNFFIASAFRQKLYLLMILAMFFMFLGMFTPLFFIPLYAVTRGVDPTFASYLLAILNAASTFGRIIPGILADRFGRINVLAGGGTVTGIIILCLNKAENTGGLVIYSIAIGFASGTVVSGAAAALSLCPKDQRDMGTYMGMGMSVGSIAALIGPPVNGALLEKYGGFVQVAIFSGIMSIAGGVLAFASKAATPQGIFGRT